MRYLDALTLLQAQVGYGELGVGGSLGYEGKHIVVGRQTYHHALSTHPPARLLFKLDGRFGGFRCQVALNDDVPAGRSHADFSVLADGRRVAAATYVVAGESPRTLQGDISGAHLLELVVQTSRWEHCHAVWLDPQVDETTVQISSETLVDCLGRVEIKLPVGIPPSERCLATVVSPKFAAMLDDMLGSFYANSGCQDALVIIFAIEADAACERVAAKYGAHLIHCRPKAQVNAMSKAVMYSVARVVEARKFICLDADMLVLGDLSSVFAALDICPEGSIFACREGNGNGLQNLGHALQSVYWGSEHELKQLLGVPADEASYPLVVNDGIFAGGRAALLALDGVIRAMPQAPIWVNQRRDNWWRNQFIFNLALARLSCGIELDPIHNIQLHAQEVQINFQEGRLQAEWRGRQVRVLHFSGVGKQKYREWQGHFARVADPLVGQGAGDGYGQFLRGLRAWVGRHGLNSLAWSFYGTMDGQAARVNDPSTLPLLAFLHYLIRSNGCQRVLETGTARGISASCLASAVAHRSQGLVVTLDPYHHPERDELWATLPPEMRACIEPRAMDSLEGMATALAAGECYDAVLLDSIHTEEHVWAEFELAKELVCPGGLILIHDPCYIHGTVEGALQRIEAAKYGVVRLWTAESGVPEDDGLGLAIIENNRRRTGHRDG